MDKGTEFGVLRYSSYNIGDEIQSVAAMQFLPQVDYYIHREKTDEFQYRTVIHINAYQR